MLIILIIRIVLVGKEGAAGLLIGYGFQILPRKETIFPLSPKKGSTGVPINGVYPEYTFVMQNLHYLLPDMGTRYDMQIRFKWEAYTSLMMYLKNHRPLTPEGEIFAMEILNFYKENEGKIISEEAITFVNEAVDAFEDGGEVDFGDRIIYDGSFEDSELECVHDELKNQNNGDNIYNDMLSIFKGDDNENSLTFSIANIPSIDWGITKGSVSNNNSAIDLYKITIDDNIENASNLAKEVTLIHEMIHAFMYDTMHNVGYLNFDSNGNPELNMTCGNVNYSGVNPNDFPIV